MDSSGLFNGPDPGPTSPEDLNDALRSQLPWEFPCESGLPQNDGLAQAARLVNERSTVPRYDSYRCVRSNGLDDIECEPGRTR